MLNKDQRERVDLLRVMGKGESKRKEEIEAFEKNFWDTQRACEGQKKKREQPDG